MAMGQGHVLIAMNQDHALTVTCQGDMLTREIHFSGSFLSRGGTLACLVVQVVGVLWGGPGFSHAEICGGLVEVANLRTRLRR